MIGFGHENGDRTKGRIDRLLSGVESAAGHGWFLLLLGWILCRNILEGVLERPQQLGFDWREEISAPMVFLHFPLFYLVLFAGISLWLYFVTRRDLEKILGAVSLGFCVLLLAPIVDAVFSRGRGYDLKYLLGFGSFLWRFWNPGAALTEVSPGQRLEILTACLMGSVYAYAARRHPPLVTAGASSGATASRGKAWVAAALAALGVYLLAALVGAWPSLFARLTLPGAAGPQEAYLRVFRQSGLIAQESRRLAVVMVLPLLIAVPVLWRCFDPTGFRKLTDRAGVTRFLHYTGMVPAGAYIGYLLYKPYFPSLMANPVDTASVAVLWASMAAAFAASLLWNDLYDRDADRINCPDQPAGYGRLTGSGLNRAAWYLAATALFLALCAGYAAFLLMIICLFLSWAYSSPPLRLKRWPGVATLTLACLSLVSALVGFSLFGQEMTPLVFPHRLAGFLIAAVTFGFTAKDLKDRRGDKATGVITLATLLAERPARRVTALLVALAFAIAPLFLPLGPAFYGLTAIFALSGASTVLRVRRPDGSLLAGSLVYALVVLAFLTRDPTLLRPKNHEGLLGPHAGMRRIEQEIGTLRSSETLDPDGEARLRASILPQIGALRSQSLHSRWLSERLNWAEAWTAEPVAAMGAAHRMLDETPLDPGTWNVYLDAANRSGQVQATVDCCTAALASSVRPGDYFRNRAAAILASAAPGYDPMLAGRDPALTASDRASIRSNPASVRSDLAAAYLLGQNRPLVLVLWGDALMKLGETERGIRSYQAAREADPDLSDAWAGLGVALASAGRTEEAATTLERAATLSPRDPWILNNLGVARRTLHRLPEAVDAFEKAHLLAPDMFEPIMNLGSACEQLGSVSEARVWYRRACEIRPGFPPAEAGRRRLEAASIGARIP